MNKNIDRTNYETPSSGGGGIGNNLMFLLIGGGIGATIALLFAPKSGAALRQDISDVTRRGYDETLELAGKLKDQSNQLYEVVRDKADQVYDFASEKLNLQNISDDLGELADNALETGKKLAGKTFDNGAADIGKQENDKGSKGSRPSNVY